MKKIVESEKVEYKSKFAGSAKEWLRIIRTIVALANTNGGEIRLFNIGRISPKEFDSAKIDDKVNSYIGPRIQNISSVNDKKIIIYVPNSVSKPHIFRKPGMYENPSPPPQQKAEFYEGQVWVRHSSENNLATKDDYDRMWAEKLDEFMKRINLVAKFPINREMKMEEIPPVKIMKRGRGMPVVVKTEEVDKLLRFSYRTEKIAEELGKNGGFVYQALKKLKISDNKDYCYTLRTVSGKVRERRFNQEAFLFLKQYLVEHPDYNPFK
ncbi:MAG: ATP-binding protein [Candidatus Margulisiibacteriota bacterium]|nr:ATP-binding protein [Candidatus Margulisiibacteriota bacterium]